MTKEYVVWLWLSFLPTVRENTGASGRERSATRPSIE